MESGVGQPAVEAPGNVEGALGVPALQDSGGYPGDDGDTGSENPLDGPGEAAEESPVREDAREGPEVFLQLGQVLAP